MSHRGFVVTAVTSAAALAAFTLAAGPSAAAQAHAAQAHAGQAHAGQAHASPAAASQPHQIMLVTGDAVNLTTSADGRQTASVIRAQDRGPGGQFQTITEGHDLYVIPQSAVPYLGSTLSPSLFDVTQLAQRENGAMALTVQLTLRSATSPVKIPGITVTHRSGTTATGQLTAASAREFGAALARQAERDHASATHTTGLFAEVANIGLTATAAPRAKPDYQMYTLTLHGINWAGKPDTGDLVVLTNAYDVAKSSGLGFTFFVNGRAKVSVPAGRYSATCFFFNFTTDTVYAVTLPQFTVTSDASSATLDARTATSPVSVRTPKPAVIAINGVTIGRGDHLGQVDTDSFDGDATTTIDVAPTTTKVTIGQLYYYVYQRLFSPAGTKQPYTYDVEFPTVGLIPADEQYVAQPGGLAAVRSSYPADHPDTPSGDARFSFLPWEAIAFATILPFTTPVQRTEYYTALPNLTWSALYFSVFNVQSFLLLGQLQGVPTVYKPGEHTSTTWGGQPEHPRLLETGPAVVCPACINGNMLYLLAYPFGDNSPNHMGFPDGRVKGVTESVAFDVYADGAKVASGTRFLLKTVTLPAGTKHLIIDYDTTRSSSSYFTLSTRAATRWTVRTGAPGGALPSGWACNVKGGTQCRVLPLMFADYRLPLNLLNQISPGPVTAGIYIGHLAGAEEVAVTSVNVAVSFNGGTSWQKAAVTAQGNGHYAVSFTVPAGAKTDGFGALRLVATDVYGGTLTQTIQHAFAIAAS